MFRQLVWRRGRVLIILVALRVVVKPASAQENSEYQLSDERTVLSIGEPGITDRQEIGASVGVAIGGDVSPGGLAAAGRHLYRLSTRDWLESGVNFSFGTGNAACFRDRANRRVCRHGQLDGFAAGATVGVRRYFAGQKQFRPFASIGVGLRLISFGGDDIRGMAMPVFFRGGVRARAAERVFVIFHATVRAGPAYFPDDLGVEAHFTGTVAAGVEFTLE